MNDVIAKPTPRRLAALPDGERWLDALPMPILGVDVGERVRFINAAAADVLSAVGRGLVGRRLGDVFGEDSQITDLVRRALAQDVTLSEADVPLEGPGFSAGRADLWAAPLEEGHFVALAIAARARVRPVETRPVSVVARTLAHEVRNPLAGIRAAAQLISKMRASPGDDVTQLTDLICDEVDRLRRLTDRIDALEGLAPPRMKPINVHEALDRVRKIIGSTFPDVEIREDYDPSLPGVLADFDQLIQAFLNIAKNAAEAARSAHHGQNAPAPTLRLSTSYRPGVRFRAAMGSAARAQLAVTFEDNGAGVPAHVLTRLFEPFVTTKPGGMGLGLAVAAEIVARHDGRIEAESAPGRTIFRLLLPLDRPEEDL
jgi:two-component system nitrogen regulation sensor histidine kinase GlnL